MAESTQSVPSATDLRTELFSPSPRPASQERETGETKDASEQPSQLDQSVSERQSTTKLNFPASYFDREVWRSRWDQSPPRWREFLSSMERVFGLSEREEEKIRTKNKTYVATTPLAKNGGLGTAMIIGTVGAFSKILMNTLNKIHTYQMEFLYDAIENRQASQGLLTFSNHQSVMDDPFLLGALLPMRILLDPEKMRWGLCSLDICFQNALVSRTLRLGKALPIQRRGGLGQPFVETAAEKLSRGDWVHIFPEGRVRQTGMGYAKRGVGKLLAMAFEARNGLPLILPMYHEGVEQVMPQNPKSNKLESSIPKTGKDLYVMTGEPLDVSHIFARLMPACAEAGGTVTDAPPCIRLYEEVADSLAITMRLLRAELRKRVRTDHNVDLGDPFEYS